LRTAGAYSILVKLQMEAQTAKMTEEAEAEAEEAEDGVLPLPAAGAMAHAGSAVSGARRRCLR
jgi:hypothetical protein